MSNPHDYRTHLVNIKKGRIEKVASRLLSSLIMETTLEDEEAISISIRVATKFIDQIDKEFQNKE